MKLTVQIVDLNDYEIGKVQEIVPVLLKLGQGYRWNHVIDEMAANIEFKIETASAAAIIVKGQFGTPKFRLAVKGPHVSFSTERAERPEFLLYNFMHILASIDPTVDKLLMPDFDALYDSMSANSNGYYLANNEYTESLPEYFRRVLTSKKELKYLSGMLTVHVTIPADGNEKARERIKEFAESSGYDDVALAAVFCRGEGVPIFYANGSIHCLSEKKDFIESFLFDFTRTFMKNSSVNRSEKPGTITHATEADYLRLNPGISRDRLNISK
ncbi:hypothetical protein ACYULU_06435 [Breznakiellaceae bacterium SP9]